MLENKIALITGAARRIGAVIARYLHQHGMNIIIHYHQSERDALALCEELNALRADSADTLKADLTQSKQLATLIEQAEQRWQRLDVLINNAAVFFPTPIHSVDQTQWQKMINTNLSAPYFLAQAALPVLRKQQGLIINITDIFSEKPLKNYSAYSISKAGLAMLTKSLAKELGPTIRVNAIAPSATLCPEEENTLSDELQEKIIQRTALKRLGDVQQIAAAALFLIESDYMTGQTITIDGGRLLD